MDDLTEARQLLARLTTIAGRLTRSDRRFLESWTAYLARTGDGAKIGPYRLAKLAKVAAGYLSETADSAPGFAPFAPSAEAEGVIR
ncbi:MAG: hypothetical protein ACREEM_13000 [Blastocatellia bacterium]